MKTIWLYFKISYNMLLCSIYTIILVISFSFVATAKMIVSKIVLSIDRKDQPRWYTRTINGIDDFIELLN